MILWTIQSPAAWAELQQKGVLRAERRHMMEATWLSAYEWMAEKMRSRIGPPPERDCLPIWAWQQWEGVERKKPDLRAGGHLAKGERGIRIEFEQADDSALLLSSVPSRRAREPNSTIGPRPPRPGSIHTHPKASEAPMGGARNRLPGPSGRPCCTWRCGIPLDGLVSFFRLTLFSAGRQHGSLPLLTCTYPVGEGSDPMSPVWDFMPVGSARRTCAGPLRRWSQERALQEGTGLHGPSGSGGVS